MKYINNAQKQGLFRFRRTRTRQHGQSLIEFALSLSLLILIFSGAIDLGRAFFTRIMLDSVISEGAHWAAAYPGCIKYGTAWNETAATHIPAPCRGDKSIKARMKWESNMDKKRLVFAELIPPAGKNEAQIVIGDTVALKATYRMELLTPLMRGLFGATLDISSEVKEVVRGDGIPDTDGMLMNSDGDLKLPEVENLDTGDCTYTPGTGMANAYAEWDAMPASGYRIYEVGAGGADGALVDTITSGGTLGTRISSNIAFPVDVISTITAGGYVTKSYRVYAYNQVLPNPPVNGYAADVVLKCWSMQPKTQTVATDNYFCNPASNGATFLWNADTPTNTYVTGYEIYNVTAGNVKRGSTTSVGTPPYSQAFTFVSPSDGTSQYVIRTVNGTTPFGLASEPFTINCQYDADLSIVKTSSHTVYQPNMPVNYTLIISNTDSTPDAYDTVTDAKVTDDFHSLLNSVTWVCTATAGSYCPASGSGDLVDQEITIKEGGTVTFEVSGTAAAAATGTITNQARVDTPASTTESDPPDNTSGIVSHNPGVLTATDLAIASLTTNQSPPSSYTPGGSIIYTFTVTNTGVNAVDAPVNVILPSYVTAVSWTCSTNVAEPASACQAPSGTGSITNHLLDLQSGGSGATFTLTANVANNAAGSLDFTAKVGVPSNFADSNISNNQKSLSSGNSTDLKIEQQPSTNPTSYTPGTLFTYDLIVTNLGPQATTADVAITVPSPMDPTQVKWTCASNYAGSATCPSAGPTTFTGSTATITGFNLGINGAVKITVSVTPPVAANTGFQTSATVTLTGANLTETDSSNNTVTHNFTYAATSTVNLGITMSPSSSLVSPGQSITYTIQISNGTSIAASGVNITWSDLSSALQNVTWCQGVTCTGSNAMPISNLAVPASSTLTIKVTGTVKSSFSGSSFSVTATLNDPDASSATVSVSVTSASIDLNITNTASASSVTAGQSVTYTLVISNPSSTAASGVAVAWSDPSTALQSVTWCQGATCTGTNSLPISNLTVPGSGSLTVKVTGTVNASFSGTSFTTTATLNDVDSSAASATVNVTSSSTTVNLGITMTVPAGTTYLPGQSITYTIVIDNSTSTNATGVAVAWSDVSSALQSVTWCSGAGCTGTNALPMTGLSVQKNKSLTLLVTGTVKSTFSGASFTTTATLNDPDTSSASVSINAATVDLATAPVNNATSYAAGSPVTLVVRVSNNTSSKVYAATFTNTFNPSASFANVTWTCAAQTSSTCPASGSGIPTNVSIDLAASSYVDFTMTADVPSGTTGTLTSTGVVAPPGSITDSVTSNNDDGVFSLSNGVSLSIAWAPTPTTTTYQPDQTLTLYFTVTNNSATAVTATISDTFTANVVDSATWSTCSNSGDTICSGAGGTVNTGTITSSMNQTVNMAGSSSNKYKVVLEVMPGVTAATTTLNYNATVSPPAGYTDTNTADNTLSTYSVSRSWPNITTFQWETCTAQNKTKPRDTTWSFSNYMVTAGSTTTHVKAQVIKITSGVTTWTLTETASGDGFTFDSPAGKTAIRLNGISTSFDDAPFYITLFYDAAGTQQMGTSNTDQMSGCPR